MAQSARSIKVTSWLSALVCAVAVGLVGTPVGATSVSEPDPDKFTVVVGSKSATFAEIRKMRQEQERTSSGNLAQPLLFDIADYMMCAVSESHAITWTDGVKPYSDGTIEFSGGRVFLHCGNLVYGYNHIKDKHELDWKKKLRSIGLGSHEALWDDFMWYASLGVMEDPSYVVGSTRNHAICYTNEVVVVNDKGMPTPGFKPTVVVEPVKRSIITSFPGAGCANHK